MLSSFECIFVVDMHGNVSRREKCPNGSPDQNVFDIKKTGTSISIFFKRSKGNEPIVKHCDLWGLRDTVKYLRLGQRTILTSAMSSLKPAVPFYLFVPQNVKALREYERGYSIADIMPIHSKGVVTGRDTFVTDFEIGPLLERMNIFATSKESDESLVPKQASFIRLQCNHAGDFIWTQPSCSSPSAG